MSSIFAQVSDRAEEMLVVNSLIIEGRARILLYILEFSLEAVLQR